MLLFVLSFASRPYLPLTFTAIPRHRAASSKSAPSLWPAGHVEHAVPRASHATPAVLALGRAGGLLGSSDTWPMRRHGRLPVDSGNDPARNCCYGCGNGHPLRGRRCRLCFLWSRPWRHPARTCPGELAAAFPRSRLPSRTTKEFARDLVLPALAQPTPQGNCSRIPLFRTFFVPPKTKGLAISQALDSTTEFGRRDWTRTNDPHHVKVVL